MCGRQVRCRYGSSRSAFIPRRTLSLVPAVANSRTPHVYGDVRKSRKSQEAAHLDMFSPSATKASRRGIMPGERTKWLLLGVGCPKYCEWHDSAIAGRIGNGMSRAGIEVQGARRSTRRNHHLYECLHSRGESRRCASRAPTPILANPPPPPSGTRSRRLGVVRFRGHLGQMARRCIRMGNGRL